MKRLEPAHVAETAKVLFIAAITILAANCASHNSSAVDRRPLTAGKWLYQGEQSSVLIIFQKDGKFVENRGWVDAGNIAPKSHRRRGTYSLGTASIDFTYFNEPSWDHAYSKHPIGPYTIRDTISWTSPDSIVLTDNKINWQMPMIRVF